MKATIWKIRIHRLVLEEDLQKINASDRAMLLKTIYKRLSIAPEKHGAPLRSPLQGYWKLRVSHFRIVYRIKKKTITVLVLKVGMRRNEAVYKEMLHRLRKI